jgi:predicted MPP superfamily phosphohydrolase
MLRIIIVVTIVFIVEIWVFSGVRTIALGMANDRMRQLILWGYVGINILFYLLVLYAFVSFSRAAGPSKLFPFLAIMFVLIWVPKLVFLVFVAVEDIYRVLRMLAVWIRSFFSNDTAELWVSRRRFISQAGAMVAAIPFVAVLYGITKGKYNFKVHNITLKFPDLPAKFHGFTITQLSDIHSGSFDNADAVRRGVALANAQNSDLLLFTGDIVNNKASEMEEWIDVFKELKAPYGKFSVFGNHDYGDYIDWPTAAMKKTNLDRLKEIHKETGFRLLLNENVKIEKDGESIVLAGVENWGLPPFPQYGNLQKALQGVDKNAFKILMSHDPSHFDAEVKHHDDHVHLTLAGHTHGMQFGIEIPGFKWSPVKYRYPKWAGLYESAQRYLYVNRGFGFLGFPGRVGIWPEITVIRLEKA